MGRICDIFQACVACCKGCDPDEARRLVLQRVPSFILRWVTEEEERKMFDSPTVRMNVPEKMNELAVSESLKRILGSKPTKVLKVGEDEFEIVLSNMSDCEKLKQFNGLNFGDSNKKCIFCIRNIL